MAKVHKVKFEDDEEIFEQADEAVSSEIEKIKELNEEEIDKVFDFEPISVEEVVNELIEVYPVRDSNSCIGGVWYYLKKGKKQKVPPHVYDFLKRNKQHPKIKYYGD